MTMARVVAAETLDGLAEDDPAAIRSRRDLQRVHRAMGTRGIVSRALRGMPVSGAAPLRSSAAPLRVLELGAGDGTLMLGVARALKVDWPHVELTLLDRQDLVTRATIEAYAALGWPAKSHVVDVLDWAVLEGAGTGGDLEEHAGGDACTIESDVPVFNSSGNGNGNGSGSGRSSSSESGTAARWDLIVANLFLHHFEGARLASLLSAVAARAERFYACEPRRAWLALAGSHLAGALGANAVTREDAVLSVHAGFRDAELTALWPDRGKWRLTEYAAGLFSHCFCAQRREVDTAPDTDVRRSHPRGGPH
mgnify:FL=1